MQHNSKQAADFLRKIASPHAPLVTVTALNTDGTVTRTFSAYEPDFYPDVNSFCKTHADDDIYYQLNGASEAKDYKLHKSDIQFIRALHVDIDPDKSLPFDEARKAVLDTASDALLGFDGPEATFAVSSGSGAQLIYKLQSPLPATESNILFAESANRALARHFKGDMATVDVSRLLRLPGTINQMRGKSKAGRSKTPAELLTKSEGKRHSPLDIELEFDLEPPPAVTRKDRPPRKRVATPLSLKQIEKALQYLDQSELDLMGEVFEYHTWMRVGFGLHLETGGSDAGFQLFDDWSATSDKYTPEETEKVWNATYDRNDRSLITGATILFMATERGWVNSLSLSGEPTYDGDIDSDGSAFAAVPEEDDDASSPSEPHVPFIDQFNESFNNYNVPVIDDLIYRNTLTVVVADANVGKSNLLASMCHSISKGQPFCSLGTTRSGVVYVALEDLPGVRSRIMAAITKGDGDLNLPVATVTDAIDLKNGPRKLMKTVRKKAAGLRAAFGVTDIVVIIDTLRDSHSAEENSNTEMMAVMKHIVELTEHYTVIVAHHSTKSALTPSGASAIRSKADTVIMMEPVKAKKKDKASDRVRITIDKQKNGAKSMSILVRTVGVDISHFVTRLDRNGNPAPLTGGYIEFVSLTDPNSVLAAQKASERALGPVSDDDAAAEAPTTRNDETASSGLPDDADDAPDNPPPVPEATLTHNANMRGILSLVATRPAGMLLTDLIDVSPFLKAEHRIYGHKNFGRTFTRRYLSEPWVDPASGARLTHKVIRNKGCVILAENVV